MSIYANHLFVPGTRNNSWAHLYEYIQEGQRVLDVGCSTGRFGEALIHLKQCEVWGIDVDKEDIDKANKHLTKALVFDINDTKSYSKLGTFDIIIFADVLEHLIDPRATLKNIKRLLNPDGRVIFSIPHMAHSSVRLDLLQGKFPYKNRGLLDNTHLHFYDMDEVYSIFEDSAYTLRQIDPVISKYSSSLLKEKLKGTGLTPNRELKQFLSDTNGDIFQIVGYAQPSSSVSRKPRRNRDYVMPQDEMADHINNVEQENEVLKAQISEIVGSTSWRVTELLRKTSAALRNIRKTK